MNKRYSLKKNRDFQYVYRRGKSVAGRYCVLIYARNRTGELKVGFSASKKIGNSVVRNRTKRLLREAFRTYLPRLQPNYHYIVIARSGITGAGYTEIADSLYALFVRANVLLQTK